jgi:hypothetical protein
MFDAPYFAGSSEKRESPVFLSLQTVSDNPRGANCIICV